MEKRKRKQGSTGRARRQVGENIRRLREARGWTQEDLAEHSGLAPAHIGRIERGELDCGINTLEALALALGVDLSRLVEDRAWRTMCALKEEYANELGAYPEKTRDGLLNVMEYVIKLIEKGEARD